MKNIVISKAYHSILMKKNRFVLVKKIVLLS